LQYAVLRRRARDKELVAGELENATDLLMSEWQERWDRSEKGRWTYEFFPCVRARLKMGLTLDHYVTQILSGHGDFGEKLHSFKLRESQLCERCGVSESARHVLFDCPDYRLPREALERTLMRRAYRWPC